MIKDNHIALHGSIEAAVGLARKRVGHAVKIEVECDNLKQVEEALAARTDIVLLDNMSLQQLRDAVALIDNIALAEASGGVNLDTVASIAQTGVDLISVGALTHGRTLIGPSGWTSEFDAAGTTAPALRANR